MHAGRRLFADAAPVLDHLVPVLRIFGMHLLQQILDDGLFMIVGGRVHPAVAVLKLIAFVDQQRCIAAIVNDQLRPQTALVAERLEGAPPVFFKRFTLPREDGNAGGGNGGGGVVLRRKDVAACPANLGAERDQRLDQHGRLNRHVQRTGDAHAGQRLGRGVLVADGHQARHLLLGHVEFLAAPVGQRHIGDLIGQPGCFKRRTRHTFLPPAATRWSRHSKFANFQLR